MVKVNDEREKVDESFFRFLIEAIKIAFSGSRRYYAWLLGLILIILLGAYSYYYQLKYGFIITGMRDQVSWGLYISNFTFFVGVAASAVMIVIPLYIYNYKEFKHIITFGEYLAVGALIIVMTNVSADIGRIERIFHMFPIVGTPNWPQSLLMWDFIVLIGYLLLNLIIPTYGLYKAYYNSKPRSWIKVLIYISVPWAISIHTVTAFIYSGLSARPFWNSALMAPRFLASAFTSGPALLIIVLLLVRHFRPEFREKISEKAIQTLAQIILIALITNLFFLGSEIYSVGYAQTSHWISLEYLIFGLENAGKYYGVLVPFFWTSLLLNLIAVFILLYPKTRKNSYSLALACFMVFIGIWLEKGMGLVIPGFVPTPIGEIWEYVPTLMEIMISFAGWALGFLIYTLLIRVTIAIESGELRHLS